METMALHRSEVLRSRRGPIVEVSIRAMFPFEGAIKDSIVELKYGRRRDVAVGLSAHLVEVIAAETGIEVITWAPTTSVRRSERGFDQSELIARHVAARSGVRHRGLLRRDNPGNQTGSPRHVRQRQPRFVGRPMRGSPFVCVIDDVVTTGATMGAAARALCEAGAGRIMCLAVAHVPDRGPSTATMAGHGAQVGSRFA